MADQTISLELQIDALDSAKTIADFKTALSDLKNTLDNTNNNFDGFAEGAAKVNDAEDKVKSLTTSISGVANAGEKISALANIGKNISTGFEAAKSAADLLSTSGNELLKVLTRVQDVTEPPKQPKIPVPKADPEIEATKTTFDSKLKIQTDFTKKSLAGFKQYQADRKTSNDAANNEELTTDKKIADAKFSIAQSSLNSITSLGELFISNQKELQQFKKDAAVVQLAIDTAKSLSSTIAGATEAAASTGPAAPFTLAAYIASGIATVLGAFARAKSILSSVGASSSPDSSSSVSAGAPSLQPLIQPTTSLSNKNQGAQNGQQQPLKVFVTESDIRNATDRINVITNRAVIH